MTGRKDTTPFQDEVLARLGVLPHFFTIGGAAPGLTEELWNFARSSYLNNPLPSLFKERLFVYLSRFCPTRYCIVRHAGFLMGLGRPAGDLHASAQTIQQVTALLRLPIPDSRALSAGLERLETQEPSASMPGAETQAETDLMEALAVIFLEPRFAERARKAVRTAYGEASLELLTAFLGFIRTAHYWTETHPELAYEQDMMALMEQHPALADLLLDTSDAESVQQGSDLRKALRDLQATQDSATRNRQHELFLLRLSDALRMLTDPSAIQQEALRQAAGYLDLDGLMYHEADPMVAVDSGQVIYVRSGFTTPGGHFPIEPTLSTIDSLTGGKTVLAEDVEADPHLGPEARSVWLTLDIKAFVLVPLVKNGKRVLNLVAYHHKPRHWDEHTVTMLEETAERTWAAVARAKIEIALREQEKRTRLAVEAADMATWEWDLVNDRVYWNEQHFHLLGRPMDANPQTSEAFIEHLHPEDADDIKAQLSDAIRNHTPYDAEFRVIRKDGITRWMSGYGQVTARQNGKAVQVSGVMFDITQRKQAEEALALADQRKDEFLAMLAHELRNPMSTLRSGLQILSHLTSENETADAAVTMMNRQTDHLVRLVDDLLDVSRISRGKIELRKEALDLVEVVRQTADSVGAFYREQGKRLHVDLPTHPIMLEGDVTRLTQVITNLLTNAARYTGERGEAWLSLQQTGKDAVLHVRDNGIGLAQDDLSAIFDLFVQVDNSTARSKGGLGLGLTLVKRLVEMHGGRAEARSEGLGKGSIFTIHLPIMHNPGERTFQAAGPVARQAGPRPILVIDDNADAATTLSMLLQLKGYLVHTRHSGQAGLEAADVLRPAAILLDIGMPGLDGYETCRLIRQQTWGSDMIVIALTGYAQLEDKQRAVEAGFTAHLVKPVDFETLTKLLKDLLD